MGVKMPALIRILHTERAIRFNVGVSVAFTWFTHWNWLQINSSMEHTNNQKTYREMVGWQTNRLYDEYNCTRHDSDLYVRISECCSNSVFIFGTLAMLFEAPFLYFCRWYVVCNVVTARGAMIVLKSVNKLYRTHKCQYRNKWYAILKKPLCALNSLYFSVL